MRHVVSLAGPRPGVGHLMMEVGAGRWRKLPCAVTRLSGGSFVCVSGWRAPGDGSSGLTLLRKRTGLLNSLGRIKLLSVAGRGSSVPALPACLSAGMAVPSGCWFDDGSSSWRAGVGVEAVASDRGRSLEATCVALGLYGGQICWPRLAQSVRVSLRWLAVLEVNGQQCPSLLGAWPLGCRLRSLARVCRSARCLRRLAFSLRVGGVCGRDAGRFAGVCGLEWLCAAARSDSEPLSGA